jgi:hypothetical protein
VVGVSAAKAHRVTQVAGAVGQWAEAVRIVRSWVRGRPYLGLAEEPTSIARQLIPTTISC